MMRIFVSNVDAANSKNVTGRAKSSGHFYAGIKRAALSGGRKHTGGSGMVRFGVVRCPVLPSGQRILHLRESKEKKEFFGYFLPATIRYHRGSEKS